MQPNKPNEQSTPVGLRSLPHRQIMITLAGVLLAMFLGSLDQTIVSTAMPRIISDLGGFAHYTWVTTAYIIASAVVIPITGKLTDIYGRKYFYIAGIAIFTAASLFSGLSNTLSQLILFRAIQGIGAGIMLANAFTAIGDLFPPAERGKYQGYISGVFGLSSVIGPTLGGYITDALSWHWVFFINIPLGLGIIILFVFTFPNFRPNRGKPSIDYAGAFALFLAVVPLLLALSWGGVEFPWSSPQILGMLAFSAVMMPLVIIIEKRSKEPIIPLGIFKNPIVSVSEIVVFLTGFGMFGGIVFIPLFFQGVLGSTATTSGNFLTPMMLGLVGGSFVSGQALSRAGGHYRFQGAAGILIMGVGMWLLSRMGTDTTSAQAIFNIVITGFGLGITLPLYVITVQNAVPYSLLGAATSSTAFLRSIGGSVGLAIFGSIMTNRFASELITRLPPALKSIIPPDELSVLTRNPQVLLSPEAQNQLQASLNILGPQGTALYSQAVEAFQQSLSIALSQIFVIGVLVLLVAFIFSLLIKEIPLRRQHMPDNPRK